MNKIVVVSPFRNCEKWIHLCIRSVKAQKYDNYEAYFVDDCSTDETGAICRKEIGDSKKIKYILNEERKYKLRGIRETLSNLKLNDEDIVTILDGDDWYSSPDTLQKLSEVYDKTGCLTTYGSYIEYPSGNRGKFSKKLPEHIFKNRDYRKYEWSTSHLFSFKMKLWNALEEEDFRDANGNYFTFATDVATIFPILEMAGDKVQFVEDILYVYNTTNPLNEHKVDHNHQLSVEKYVRSRKKKEVL